MTVLKRLGSAATFTGTGGFNEIIPDVGDVWIVMWICGPVCLPGLPFYGADVCDRVRVTSRAEGFRPENKPKIN